MPPIRPIWLRSSIWKLDSIILSWITAGNDFGQLLPLCGRCFGYLGTDGWDWCDGSRCHQGTAISAGRQRLMAAPHPPPCPPLPHLARQQMHCGRSHRPWVVDTSLTAHSTVSTFFIQILSFGRMREAKRKNFILSFLIAYHRIST